MMDALRVVVGVDLEGGSKSAVAFAMKLCEGGQAEVSLVHVVESTKRFWALGPPMEFAVMKSLGEQALAPLLKTLPGQVETVVRQGHPVRELLDVCAQREAGLLILGHPHEGCMDPLIGGTAQRILRSAHLPVMIYKGERLEVPGHLVVAVDLSPCSVGALQFGVRWASRFSAEIHVLHVFDVPAFSFLPGVSAEPVYPMEQIKQAESKKLDRLLEETDWQGVRHDVLRREGDPASTIVETAERLDGCMLIMGTHGRTGLKRILLGSVAEFVARRVRHSVLVAPHRID